MKYLKQLAIILIVSCLGELCAWLLPFPIPGCLYGLVLMFTALCLKIIKLEQVEDVSHFLIEIMPLMFTPPAVGLITMWSVLGDIWPQVLGIVVLTTFIVMFVTGHVAQFVLRHEPHISPDPRKWFHHTDIHGGAHPVS
ncbi:MAG: CidA/LrgA family protein [Proteobacteria bacterium]|nr:CidA/LrgA family protein [Pseudomonadota bacterium]